MIDFQILYANHQKQFYLLVTNSFYIIKKIMSAEKNLQSTTRLRNINSPSIDIVFKNLSYTIETKDEQETFFNKLPMIKRQILKNITGIIPHGKVTAIMGASGAGKTSLLNLLACRIDKSTNIHIDGQILVNKVPYNFENFGGFANYVMQNDILMHTLTVRETLEFAASLKLNLTDELKDTKIMKLVKDLNLEKCLDTLVGNAQLKGISGGEKKRTSIAFELISDPQVLFLDEPTSGLDSLTAYVIVWYMKELALNQNKTIAMTIHQPNSQIFGIFDNLILMVQGKLVYQGLAQQSVRYFSEMGFRCPEYSNPPDYFMSIMHHQDQKNVQNFQLYFNNYQKILAPKIITLIESCEVEKIQERIINTSAWSNIGTLLKRDFINIRRNPIILTSRFIQTVIVGLIIGGLFWDLSSDYSLQGYSQGFNSKNGVCFFLGIQTFMTSLAPMMLTFPVQRSVFLKEQNSKLYSVLSYFLSRNIIQIPYLMIIPLLSSLIVYWMIGFSSTPQQYFLYFFTTFICSLAGNSFGLLLGSFFSDPKVASGLIPLIVLPMMLFSGFYKNSGDLPKWISWIQYFSPIKYTFIALTNNEYMNTDAPISLLNHDLDMYAALGVMIGLGFFARFISFIVLSLLKEKLQ